MEAAVRKKASNHIVTTMKTLAKLLFLATLSTLSAISLSAAEPREIWDKHCASCHGKDGKGETKMGKKLEVRDYTDPKVQEAIKDDKAIQAIKDGITEKGKEKMKPFKDKVSDEETKELLKLIRSIKRG